MELGFGAVRANCAFTCLSVAMKECVALLVPKQPQDHCTEVKTGVQVNAWALRLSVVKDN